MRIHGNIALTDPAAPVGAIEDRQVLGLEVGRSFYRHGPAAIIVGRRDFFLGKSQRLQHIEVGFVQLQVGQSQLLPAEVLAQRIFIKDKLDFEGLSQSAFHTRERGIVEALLSQGLMVDERRSLQSLPTGAIVHDVLDLSLGIFQGSKGGRDALIDDLEIASARQLLELYQREVRLDAGRVAIHHESDRPGRGDHRDLRIAIAVGRAQFESPVPGAARRHEQLRRAMLRLDSDRRNR